MGFGGQFSASILPSEVLGGLTGFPRGGGSLWSSRKSDWKWEIICFTRITYFFFLCKFCIHSNSTPGNCIQESMPKNTLFSEMLRGISTLGNMITTQRAMGENMGGPPPCLGSRQQAGSRGRKRMTGISEAELRKNMAQGPGRHESPEELVLVLSQEMDEVPVAPTL